MLVVKTLNRVSTYLDNENPRIDGRGHVQRISVENSVNIRGLGVVYVVILGLFYSS